MNAIVLIVIVIYVILKFNLYILKNKINLKWKENKENDKLVFEEFLDDYNEEKLDLIHNDILSKNKISIFYFLYINKSEWGLVQFITQIST